MKKGPATPKGFRDIDPPLARKKREVINMIASALEEFDFVPLETPIVEFSETLSGKYGEEEKLIYKFKDRGGRDLALRYDLTVPLARYVANNLNLISGKSFCRYQWGEVFRGENTQKGRYREFTQFDFDVVGSEDVKDDAKVIASAIDAARRLGLARAKMIVNDRRNFSGVPIEVVRIIDKLDKIGVEGIEVELKAKNYSGDDIEKYKKLMTDSSQKEILGGLFRILKAEYKLQENKDFDFSPSLARGLDYYTGTVFELKPEGRVDEQSIGGGGRYDNLIGMFAGRAIPAVGFSFGLDRLLTLL